MSLKGKLPVISTCERVKPECCHCMQRLQVMLPDSSVSVKPKVLVQAIRRC